MRTVDLPAPPPEVAERYTPEVLRTIARLRAWMAEPDAEDDRTVRGVATALHVSRTQVSRFRNCKWEGDVGGLAKKVERLLAHSRERAAAPTRPEFRETSISERVEDVLGRAHVLGGMAAVLGPTGIGKTMAVRHYAEGEPGTVYIEAGPLCRSYALMRELGRQLGVKWAGSKYTTLGALGEALRGTDRLIIIDEADYLAEEALHVLRQISDRSGVGIVLVGTEGLLQHLRELNSATLNQVLGRIAYTEHLSRIAEEDLEAITAGVALDDDARRELARQAHGQARRAVAALMTAQAAAGDGAVTAKLVRRAYCTLMPVLNGLPKER